MPIPSPAPGRAELIDHLVRTRIAGNVATPRDNNLSHYRKLANGDRHYWLGLELGDRWTDEQDVLAVMAERCGVVDDPGHRAGQDTIDPGLTVDALDRMAAVLRKSAGEGHRVLFATGHPGGLLDVHRTVAAGMRAAGCEVMEIPGGLRADEGFVVQFADVAVLERGATLWHTHSPAPMAAILDALERAGGPCRIWWWRTTAGRAARASAASRRWGSPTATTRRCSWARRRAPSPSRYRWTTTSSTRASTTR